MLLREAYQALTVAEAHEKTQEIARQLRAVARECSDAAGAMARDLLQKFPSEKALAGPDCKGHLIAFSIVAYKHIRHIEEKHA